MVLLQVVDRLQLFEHQVHGFWVALHWCSGLVWWAPAENTLTSVRVYPTDELLQCLLLVFATRVTLTRVRILECLKWPEFGLKFRRKHFILAPVQRFLHSLGSQDLLDNTNFLVLLFDFATGLLLKELELLHELRVGGEIVTRLGSHELLDEVLHILLMVVFNLVDIVVFVQVLLLLVKSIAEGDFSLQVLQARDRGDRRWLTRLVVGAHLLLLVLAQVRLGEQLDLLLKAWNCHGCLVLEWKRLLQAQCLALVITDGVHVRVWMTTLQILGRLCFAQHCMSATVSHLIKGSEGPSHISERVLVELAEDRVLLLLTLG
jgi:hypothetical protein